MIDDRWSYDDDMKLMVILQVIPHKVDTPLQVNLEPLVDIPHKQEDTPLQVNLELHLQDILLRVDTPLQVNMEPLVDIPHKVDIPLNNQEEPLELIPVIN